MALTTPNKWHFYLSFIVLFASSRAQAMHGEAVIPEYIQPQPQSRLSSIMHRIGNRLTTVYHAIPSFIRTSVGAGMGIGVLLALEHGPDLVNWYLNCTNANTTRVSQDIENIYAQGNTLNTLGTAILGPLLSTPLVLTARAACANQRLLYNHYSNLYGYGIRRDPLTIFAGGNTDDPRTTYTAAELIVVNLGALAALIGLPIQRCLIRSLLVPRFHVAFLPAEFRPLKDSIVFYLIFLATNKLVTMCVHA